MKSPPRKPFYSSITVIFFLPVLLVILNFALLISLGIRTYDEGRIDKLLHVFGGISISFSIAGILWHLVRWEIITLQDKNVFRFLVFGFVCFAAIGWEILEYIFPSIAGFMTYSDTITDLICGLIGGTLAIFFIRRPLLVRKIVDSNLSQ